MWCLNMNKWGMFVLGAVFWLLPGLGLGFEAEISGFLMQKLSRTEGVEPRVTAALRLKAQCQTGPLRQEAVDGWSYTVFPLTCRTKLFCGREHLFEVRTFVEGLGRDETLARRDAVLRTVEALWPATCAWALALSRSLVLGELEAGLRELEGLLQDVSTGAEAVSRPAEELLEALSRALKEIGEEDQL